MGKQAGTLMIRLRGIGVFPLAPSSSIPVIGGHVDTSSAGTPELEAGRKYIASASQVLPRPEAVRNLIVAVRQAADQIEATPPAGLPLPHQAIAGTFAGSGWPHEARAIP